MRISDWSSDVCSSDLVVELDQRQDGAELLFLDDAAVLGRIVEDGDRDEITGHIGRLAADKKCVAFVPGILDQLEDAGVFRRIVDRADLRPLLRAVADLHRPGISDERILQLLVNVAVPIPSLCRYADLAVVAECRPKTLPP